MSLTKNNKILTKTSESHKLLVNYDQEKYSKA